MNSKKKLNISEYLKKKNVKRFSLFFVIAFVFLIFSKLSNDYKQTIKLKINLVNAEDEIILQNDSLNTIDAYIEAKGFALIPFIFKKYKSIVIDAKTDIVTTPAHFIFDVDKHQFLIEGQLGATYKVLSIKPDTLAMPYSKRASRYIPIDLITDISYTTGFDLKDDFIFDVDSVKIVGASDVVNKIEVIATHILSLNDVNKDINETITLDLSEQKNIEVFPKSVKVSGMVKRFTEGTVEVPIIITNKPANTTINYFPKTVTVTYYVDLDNYNAITASDFEVECNYLVTEESQNYFVPEIVKQPEFVKRIGMKQKRIDFIKL